MKTRGRPRLVLLGLFALFLLPVVAAIVLRASPELLPGLTTTNAGELLAPPRAIDSQGLRLLLPAQGDGESALFAEHWTLILMDDGQCPEACLERLQQLWRVRVALNKDMDRLDLLLLLPETSGTPAGLETLAGSAGAALRVASASPQWRARLADVPGALQPGHLYVVDPRGFLFLHFTAQAPPADVLKDLKRLLKISRVG